MLYHELHFAKPLNVLVSKSHENIQTLIFSVKQNVIYFFHTYPSILVNFPSGVGMGLMYSRTDDINSGSLSLENIGGFLGLKP